MTFTLVALILAAEPMLAPPLVTADGAVQQRPARLKYRGKVPEGYRLVEAPNWALIAPGISMFVLAYGMWAGHGTTVGSPETLVPIVGPALACRCGSNQLIWMLVGLDMAVQVAGLTAVMIGLLLPKRWLQRDDGVPALSFVPTVAGGTYGASVVGHF